VKRASKPNKKIPTASRLLSVHSLLIHIMSLGLHRLSDIPAYPFISGIFNDVLHELGLQYDEDAAATVQRDHDGQSRDFSAKTNNSGVQYIFCTCTVVFTQKYDAKAQRLRFLALNIIIFNI
jgi:hypothetical protein